MATSPCFLSQVTPKELEKYLDKNPKVPGAYWRFFKDNYLNKGIDPDEAAAIAANDIGMPLGHFRRILDRPKSIRPFKLAVANAAKIRRDFLKDNERKVRQLTEPYFMKFLRGLRDTPRTVLLWEHGGTPMSTHAQPYLQRVDKIHLWLHGVLRENMAIIPKYEEKIRRDTEAHPLFNVAKLRYGLDLDWKTQPHGWLPTSGWTMRAWNASLIPLRLRDFEGKMKFWTKNNAALWTDDLGKAIATEVNHATGTLSPGEKPFLGSEFALSPTLTSATWYKAIFDPLETIKTYGTIAESKINKNLYVDASVRRANYMRTINQAAWLTSTYGWLVLNQALLKASGSNQQINMGFGGDWSKTDLWRYKAGGWIIRPRGGIENLALLARLIALSTKSRKELHGQTVQEKQQQMIGQYAEYKAHPGISIGVELVTGETLYGERVPKEMEEFFPWMRGKPHPISQRQLGWSEYLAQHGPIWIGGAVREYVDALREQGMATSDIHSLLKGLSNPEALKRAGVAALSEYYGIGIYKERPPRPPAQRGGRSKSTYSVTGG